VRLVEQWRRIEAELPADWAAARVLLTLADERRAARAAGLLAPLYAGRSGGEVRFSCARRGLGPRPDTVRRLLWGLDRERIAGTLAVVEIQEVEEEPRTADERPSLAAVWEATQAALPPDWSHAYVELALRASDQLARAALLLAPVNPLRAGEAPVLRFRAASRLGYGASAEMVRRCLERLDADEIRGELRLLRAVSSSDPVATQGPVWYIGGRSV
jgi:hypothetical protein